MTVRQITTSTADGASVTLSLQDPPTAETLDALEAALVAMLRALRSGDAPVRLDPRAGALEYASWAAHLGH